MKRVLRMKPITKYTILFILDLIYVFNLPLLMRDVNTINDYRFNMLLLFALFFVNAIASIQIEKQVRR